MKIAQSEYMYPLVLMIAIKIDGERERERESDGGSRKLIWLGQVVGGELDHVNGRNEHHLI